MAAASKPMPQGRRATLLPLLALASAAALLAHHWAAAFAPAGRGAQAGGPSRLSLRAAPSSSSAAQAGAALGAAVGEAAGSVVDDLLQTPRDEAKARLLDLLEDPTVAKEVLQPTGKALRGQVDEAIVRLESLCPTEEPVYSDLLDGTWIVKYPGTYAPGILSSPTRELALFLYGGGFSLGNALSSFANGFWGQTLGLSVTGKTVRISGLGRDVDASAKVEVAGQTQALSYSAELLPLSSRRMSEEVLELRLPGPLGSQKPLVELQRSILVTYLDKDVMIVRDESGVPEVLVRELAPVPADDLLPPRGGNTTEATADAASRK